MSTNNVVYILVLYILVLCIPNRKGESPTHIIYCFMHVTKSGIIYIDIYLLNHAWYHSILLVALVTG